MTDLPLSPGLRDNLLALAETNRQIAQGSARLASGLRVTSPGDDLRAWLQASDLSSQADTLASRRQGLVEALGSLEVAIHTAQGVKEALGAMQQQLDATRSLQVVPLYEAAVATGVPAIALSFNTNWNTGIRQINSLVDDATFNGVNLVGDADSRVAAWAPSTATVQPGSSGGTYQLPSVYLGNPLVLDRRSAGQNQISVLDPVTNTDYSIGAGDVSPLYNATALATPQRPTTGVDARAQAVGTVSYRYKVVSWSANVRQVAVYQDTVVAPNTISFGLVPLDGALTRSINRTGLGLLSAQMYDGFLTQGGRDAASSDLAAARGTVDGALEQFGTAQQYLQTRLDMLDKMVNELRGGADKLVRTDLNAEGATLLAAQTLQRTGTAAADYEASAASGLVSLISQALARR